jgi:pimeloyl-ACP methyl ester carboxylesterase
MAGEPGVDPCGLARRAVRDDDLGPGLSHHGGALSGSRTLTLASGIDYHCLEWGADARGETTVVLVHGFADLAAAWEPVATRLAAAGLHVVAPDLRGHGDSGWIGAGGYYHFMDYVVDLDEVIARLARPRLVLVGHSLGGSVCGYWAGTRPQRSAALALLEGLGPPDQSAHDLPTRTAAWIEAWRGARSPRKRVMESVEAAAARLRKHDPLVEPAEALRVARAGTRPVEGGGVTWKQDPLHHTMGPYPFRLDVAMQFWRRVACPVLIVDGADSKMNLPEDERARRRAVFAKHRHVVVAGAGHAVARHQPARIAELIAAL